MYYLRSIVTAALIGFGAATMHEQMGAVTTVTAEAAMAATSASVMHEGMASTALAAMVSETVAASYPTLSAPPAQAAAPSNVAAAEGQVNTHVVQVGFNGTLTFSPNNVIAAAGDLVQFQFHPKNHSVVQSTFDNPCVPIQNIMPNKTDAFFSGFMPTAANASKIMTYTIRIMDTKPVWLYCSQGKHCQSGMVGAINAVTSGNKTVEAFAGLAAGAAENLSPGQAPGGGAAASAPPPGVAASSAAGGEGVAATGTAGGVATTSSASNPAEQTTNAAPGRFSDVGRQSFLGLGLGGLAAFLML